MNLRGLLKNFFGRTPEDPEKTKRAELRAKQKAARQRLSNAIQLAAGVTEGKGFRQPPMTRPGMGRRGPLSERGPRKLRSFAFGHGKPALLRSTPRRREAVAL